MKENEKNVYCRWKNWRKMCANEENMQKSFGNDRFSYLFEINIIFICCLWMSLAADESSKNIEDLII